MFLLFHTFFCTIPIITDHNGHIIILEHASGMIRLNHAIRTSRYYRNVPYYNTYTRIKKNNNGSSVLARKIIIQSLICLAIIFSVIYMQNSSEELHRNVIATVRILLVEKHTSPEDIYQKVAETYRECVEYIEGNNR